MPAVPPVATPAGELTPFGEQMAQSYARAVVGHDAEHVHKLRTTFAGNPKAWGPVARLCDDIDRDPALAAMMAE